MCRIISLMLFSLRPDVVQPAAPSPHYRVIHFDVSGVDLTNSTLVKAEFRIFRAPNPQARASEQRVEIYQVNSWMTSKVHFYFFINTAVDSECSRIANLFKCLKHYQAGTLQIVLSSNLLRPTKSMFPQTRIIKFSTIKEAEAGAVVLSTDSHSQSCVWVTGSTVQIWVFCVSVSSFRVLGIRPRRWLWHWIFTTYRNTLVPGNWVNMTYMSKCYAHHV